MRKAIIDPLSVWCNYPAMVEHTSHCGATGKLGD